MGTHEAANRACASVHAVWGRPSDRCADVPDRRRRQLLPVWRTVLGRLCKSRLPHRPRIVDHWGTRDIGAVASQKRTFCSGHLEMRVQLPTAGASAFRGTLPPIDVDCKPDCGGRIGWPRREPASAPNGVIAVAGPRRQDRTEGVSGDVAPARNGGGPIACGARAVAAGSTWPRRSDARWRTSAEILRRTRNHRRANLFVNTDAAPPLCAATAPVYIVPHCFRLWNKSETRAQGTRSDREARCRGPRPDDPRHTAVRAPT